MSVLRRRHKCQFVFDLFFVYFLNQFLGSFEVKKLKKTVKFKLGGEIPMQMSFWSSPDRFVTSWEGVLDPLCRPRGSLGAPLGSPGRPKNCPNWGPGGLKQKVGLAFLLLWRPDGLPGPIWEPFLWFLTIFQGFTRQNFNFQKKHHFYLHNSHARCLLCR